MWTPTTRQKYSRTVTRYQTDLTDTEWRVIAPHLPKPCAVGRPREWQMREIVQRRSPLRCSIQADRQALPSGPREVAETLCSRLRAAGGSCLVQSN
jgi:transposase